ncbi:LytR/AlgR family response regulator transcription factor [Mucilaginibacter dorajii]|uniref:LytTR family DNA-binding domain-containing protein n=1 Tax=Mucilaginibacter dorajii TaxID=692994 RepID=A0ABP7NZD4_9SPHI|nr:LytTR family transcriptional regulator DNA-binding domain-containing protein [Mucilaginibacter dorajii]MCS3737966.1 DNA-binding LytR/AlgR family response regulator [Mucilaginibacter dorajii]
MKISCLVVDDKPLAIDIIIDYISKVPFLELVAQTTNPIEALHMLNETAIHLVFLDIQMPELNGLQFIKIAGKKCKVILTTAYAEYALEGYDHDVIDYLLKPIPFNRFYQAAEKARQLILQPQTFIEAPIAIPSEEPALDYIFVKTEHRIQKVNIKDLLYIESLQNYIVLHTAKEKIMSLQTLKKIEEQLPKKEFVRVHKSFVVGLRHISFVERSRIAIADIIIPVGETYRDGFYKLIDKA